MAGSSRRKSVSFSKLDYFGVEGNLVYESEDALSRGHVLVKRRRLAHQNPWFWNRTLTRRACSRSLILDGTILFIILCKLLWRVMLIVIVSLMPTIWRPCQGIWQMGLSRLAWLSRRRREYCFKRGPLLLRKLNCCSINQQSWMRLFGRPFRWCEANKSLATNPENTQGVWILDFLGNLNGMAYQSSCILNTRLKWRAILIALQRQPMECAQPFSQEQIVSLIGALKGADATPLAPG